MRRPALLLVIGALVLAGCGDDGGRSSTPSGEAVAGWSRGEETVTMPLGENQELATPQGAIEAWAAALNARNWSRACGLSLVPVELPCESLLRDAVRGPVEVEGAYMNGSAGSREGTFAASGLEGVRELSVEEHLGGYRVHFEVQRIR